MRETSFFRSDLASARLVDSHVHTHLCDGKEDMTVENIGEIARRKGLSCVILTPHFHKRLEKDWESLYENSREEIFLSLREEISFFEKKEDRVKFFLSTEADIINESGEISLSLSAEAERALDFVTPTLNFHPLLPLRFVALTYGKSINALHDSGEFEQAAAACGGVSRLLEEEWAIRERAAALCPYPFMAGHVFASCSKHPDRYAWFHPKKEHLPLMEKCAEAFLRRVAEKGGAVDLTGVHLRGASPKEKGEQNGFLLSFQSRFIALCQKYSVPYYYGSDAHRTEKVGEERSYYETVLSI